MQIVVLASKVQRAELNASPSANLIWINDDKEFLQYPSADVFIDLEYFNTEERNQVLLQLLPKTVIVNSVSETLSQLPPSFVRINGWPGFLGEIIEGTCPEEGHRRVADEAFLMLRRRLEWLPDEPGFVSARVICMIINEAFIALADGVSSKEDIDTAMKLGTAYPFGPFEWAEKIGLQNVVNLLLALAAKQPHYQPSQLMVQETDKAI